MLKLLVLTRLYLRTEDPEAQDCPYPSSLQQYSEQPYVWAQQELGPAGKHVANEALCSPATYWVLDSLPDALVAIQFTEHASSWCVSNCGLAANPIKDAFFYKELKHSINYEYGGEVK